MSTVLEEMMKGHPGPWYQTLWSPQRERPIWCYDDADGNRVPPDCVLTAVESCVCGMRLGRRPPPMAHIKSIAELIEEHGKGRLEYGPELYRPDGIARAWPAEGGEPMLGVWTEDYMTVIAHSLEDVYDVLHEECGLNKEESAELEWRKMGVHEELSVDYTFAVITKEADDWVLMNGRGWLCGQDS